MTTALVSKNSSPFLTSVLQRAVCDVCWQRAAVSRHVSHVNKHNFLQPELRDGTTIVHTPRGCLSYTHCVWIQLSFNNLGAISSHMQHLHWHTLISSFANWSSWPWLIACSLREALKVINLWKAELMRDVSIPPSLLLLFKTQGEREALVTFVSNDLYKCTNVAASTIRINASPEVSVLHWYFIFITFRRPNSVF